MSAHKIKKPKVSKKNIKWYKSSKLLSFNPVWTYHALKRLSDRIQVKRNRVINIRVCWKLVRWPVYTWWIDPDLIRKCNEDMKHSIFHGCHWDSDTMRFAIVGKIATYIIWRDSSIITVYKEFTIDQKKSYKLMKHSDIKILFALDI